MNGSIQIRRFKIRDFVEVTFLFLHGFERLLVADATSGQRRWQTHACLLVLADDVARRWSRRTVGLSDRDAAHVVFGLLGSNLSQNDLQVRRLRDVQEILWVLAPVLVLSRSNHAATTGGLLLPLAFQQCFGGLRKRNQVNVLGGKYSQEEMLAVLLVDRANVHHAWHYDVVAGLLLVDVSQRDRFGNLALCKPILVFTRV